MSYCQLWIWAGAVVALVGIWKYFSSTKKQKVLEKWVQKSQNGKVILHGMYGNNDVLPTASPFVLKLETYLRMTNIPYETDKVDMWGPKGKTPWISYKGEHYADSQFIVEFLSKEIAKDFSSKYTKKELAIGTMARVLVEEHLYWVGVMWRFAFGGKDTFQQVRNGERKLFQWFIFRMIAPQMRSMAWSQGVGRHSESEIKALMLKDLLSLSAVLGEKKFLLGDEASEDDCSVFAGIASAVFLPTSPVQEHFNGELKNLKEYCHRMRDKFWPDWETAIKSSNKND